MAQIFQIFVHFIKTFMFISTNSGKISEILLSLSKPAFFRISLTSSKILRKIHDYSWKFLWKFQENSRKILTGWFFFMYENKLSPPPIKVPSCVYTNGEVLCELPPLIYFCDDVIIRKSNFHGIIVTFLVTCQLDIWAAYHLWRVYGHHERWCVFVRWKPMKSWEKMKSNMSVRVTTKIVKIEFKTWCRGCLTHYSSSQTNMSDQNNGKVLYENLTGRWLSHCLYSDLVSLPSKAGCP